MKLPGANEAFVDITKLRDYCLSPIHPRGKHKARVFAAALGLTADDAEALRGALLEAAQEGEASLGENDEYGSRYLLDFEITTEVRHATVHSIWIVRRGELLSSLGVVAMVKQLDTVALTEDIPARGLLRGQVGTVVETLAEDVFEVEFSDNEGQSYAMLPLRGDQLMVLHHELLSA